MMRYLVFILLIFITACGVSKISQDDQGDFSVLAPPTNKMIVVEQGRSNLRDIGEVLDSNDVVTNSDTLTTIATKADVASAGASQLLSNQNDSLQISGGNLVRRDVVFLDSVDQISAGNYALNTIIELRDNGAKYKVFQDSIAGYVNDGVAVIDLSPHYAVLTNTEIRTSFFFERTDTTDERRDLTQSAIDFSINQNKNLIIDRQFQIDTTLIIDGVSNWKLIFEGEGQIKQVGPVPDLVAKTVSNNYNTFELKNVYNVTIESPHITGENPYHFILGLGNQSQAFQLIGTNLERSSNVRFNNVRIKGIIGSAFQSVAGEYFSNIIIDGGIITDCAKSAANINAANLQMKNLRIERCKSGAELAGSRNTHFVDNYVKNTAHSGISVGGNTGSLFSPTDSTYRTDIDSVFNARKHEGNVVANNTFYRCGISLDTLDDNSGAIVLATGATRTIIDGNTIYYSGREGISVVGGANNPIIRPMIINNRIVNASLASNTGAKAGIYSVVPAIVRNNTIEHMPEDTLFNMNRGIFFSTSVYPIDSTDAPFRDSIYIATNNYINVPFQGIYAQGTANQGAELFERNNHFADADLVLGPFVTNLSKIENTTLELQDSLFLVNYTDGPLEVSGGKVVVASGGSVNTIYSANDQLPSDREVDVNSNMLILEGVNDGTYGSADAGGLTLWRNNTSETTHMLYRANGGGVIRVQQSGLAFATNNAYIEQVVLSNIPSLIINKDAAGVTSNLVFRDENVNEAGIGLYESGGNTEFRMVTGSTVAAGIGIKMDWNQTVDMNFLDDTVTVSGDLAVDGSILAGGIVDQGDYSLQVNGDSYTSGQVTAPDHKQYGNDSVVTDGSGDITVTFGTAFSATPGFIFVHAEGTTFSVCQVYASSTTDFSFRVFDDAGAAITSTIVSFSWMAIR